MARDKKGFTLIEVLMVVAIIGVLAALVIPRYMGQGERGYVAEAAAMLSALRQGEVAYSLENSAAYTATTSALDVDISPSTKFTYSVTTASSLVTATRAGGGTTYSGTTITLGIDTGTWGGTHPFKPNN
ncbi:MAG: prepilin-type N-terminal cleavage/methylation domain-containing protein [Candidatus Omnitrophota bacterium]